MTDRQTDRHTDKGDKHINILNVLHIYNCKSPRFPFQLNWQQIDFNNFLDLETPNHVCPTRC